MKVIVTGANGFVGRTLCSAMEKKDFKLLEVVRCDDGKFPGKRIAVGNINGRTCWDNVFKKIDSVVHLAARVHIMNDHSSNPLEMFREINLHGTSRLAVEAARQGVRRFVYISSVKVNGEGSENVYTENDSASPLDSYGISKYEAEEELKRIAIQTGMEVVILRPPLVYGAGVKANLLRLLKLVSTGLPLPLGSVNNKRSMIYVENFADAIIAAVSHPKAAGETFLVSDGEDLSTKELVKQIADSMGKRVYLLPVPCVGLELIGTLLGKSAEIKRLTGSLRINIDKISHVLEWKPPFNIKTGIKKTVDWYMKQVG